LKAELLRSWDKRVRDEITTTQSVALEGKFAEYVHKFDFSIFKPMSVREVIEQHRTSPYFIPRFGGGLLARPKPAAPPDEIQGHESTYVGKLLDAYALIGLFRPRAALIAEILVLRHQLNILRRKSPKRLSFSSVDRLLLAGICRLAPRVLDALKIMMPDIAALAPRRLPSLLALEMPAARGSADNTSGHSPPHPRRQAPQYIIRDRDRAYGHAFLRRLRAMGIRDRPIAPRSPWQNGCAERLIGSIRRDCLDHVLVFGERHLRHLLKSYQEYYNEARTHLSLQKDAPIPRAVQAAGQTFAVPILGGLHHQYIRA
jgi:hypothetical protein